MHVYILYVAVQQLLHEGGMKVPEHVCKRGDSGKRTLSFLSSWTLNPQGQIAKPQFCSYLSLWMSCVTQGKIDSYHKCGLLSNTGGKVWSCSLNPQFTHVFLFCRKLVCYITTYLYIHL